MDAATPKKVLIVEDEQALGKILVDRLNAEGYVTFYEENGQNGLTRAVTEHPDLIILDLIMPIMDGIEMLQNLRKDNWGKNAKVIIMTNITNDQKMEEAMKQGVYEYLVKSNWDLDDVIGKIQNNLDS